MKKIFKNLLNVGFVIIFMLMAMLNKRSLSYHWKNVDTSALRDCNNNVTLNHKTPVVFQNLTNYHSHLNM